MIVIDQLLECREYLHNMEAVIFDLDDTLYSEKMYVRSGYQAVAAAFAQVDKMSEKLWNAFENGIPAIDHVLTEEGLLCQENKAKALSVYRNHIPKIELYPGIRQLLESLSAEKKLGMITDGRPEGQWAKIEALQIGCYFDKIIVTDDLGGPEFRKPNEIAFRLMQQALDVPFDKMVYIGDNIRKDFIAPQSLGMQAIYFNNSDGLYRG